MTDRSLVPCPPAGGKRPPVFRRPAWPSTPVAVALAAVVLASPVCFAVFTHILKPGAESDWRLARGRWTMRAGEFEQTVPDRLSCA